MKDNSSIIQSIISSGNMIIKTFEIILSFITQYISLANSSVNKDIQQLILSLIHIVFIVEKQAIPLIATYILTNKKLLFDILAKIYYEDTAISSSHSIHILAKMFSDELVRF